MVWIGNKWTFCGAHLDKLLQESDVIENIDPFQLPVKARLGPIHARIEIAFRCVNILNI